MALTEKIANLTFSVNVVIGKTCWKSVVQSKDSECEFCGCVEWGREKKLQRVENKVWKHQCIEHGVSTLFGEIGASTVYRRDRMIKLGFGQYMLRTSNGLLSAIIGRMKGESSPGGGGDKAAEGIHRRDGPWFRYAEEYD